MLVDLSIHSFVLIDRLDLSPVDGFTALTGETGAGKSIILDALSIALGGSADRGMIRAGDVRASVSAAFSVPPGHGVWAALEAADLDAECDELLTLKRVIPRKGAIRAYINDQPVSAARLREIGEHLVELHGQHAAMGLLRPQTHRVLLDQYARNGDLLEACAAAWTAFEAAREVRERLASDLGSQSERLAALGRDLAALDEVSATSGEAETLAAERAMLAQGQRLRDGLGEAESALGRGPAREAVAVAARTSERLCRLPGLDAEATPLGARLRQLGEGLERALIELDEAESLLSALAVEIDSDDGRLEAVEARLFAIRGLARRFGVEPDELPALRDRLASECATLDDCEAALAEAKAVETAAKARWRSVAERLTDARKSAAGRLETAVMSELKPLKMASTRLRFAMKTEADVTCGRLGQDRISIEVETTKGGGFGAVGKIASGGELARLALALRCAMADVGEAQVLVFDEADQGVGGAVAAAIGDRLAHLGRNRQVFAVTHSPQVAAAGADQWQIEKRAGADGKGRTHVSHLDETARLEEVARMLSGKTVTREARQAAARLLEVSCPRPSP
ncbi:MAG: DNA repair protein RecN [Pseudomonadota bacterium]